MYPQAVAKEEISLDMQAERLAEQLLAAKSVVREAEASIDNAEKQIKELMGQAERGRAGRFVINWPMRNYKAAAERLVPAKEAYSVRQSTLTIKEQS